MSLTAERESRAARHLCRACRDRKARFQHRGSVRADRHHTLCFECYRAERERLRAGQLAGGAQSSGGSAADAPRALDLRQIAHRRAMLIHLAGQGRRG